MIFVEQKEKSPSLLNEQGEGTFIIWSFFG